MKIIMKEDVKRKTSRGNEFGLVAFLPGIIKSLGVFNNDSFFPSRCSESTKFITWDSYY